MLLRLYEKVLERRIKNVPSHIVVVSSNFDVKKFEEFLGWCRRFGIREITLCLHEDIDFAISGVRVRKISNGEVEERGEGDLMVNLIAAFDGRKELVRAIRKIAEMVEAGKIEPEDVDESVIEAHLAVKSQPDMIVKVGNDIPEFLIWQSIYSELYFADTDWCNFRYVDFLRMLREYQRRERRYGR